MRGRAAFRQPSPAPASYSAAAAGALQNGQRYTESLTNEIRSFVKSVVEDKPTAVTGLDGRIPVVMGLAARKSFDERRPVRVDEIR